MGATVALEVGRARALCLAVLAQVGVPQQESELGADSLVEASLRGVDSHGVALLPVYVERIRSGQIRPGRAWVVRREGPATALCDGQGGWGPSLACAAMDLACDKTRHYGLGAVSLVDGNYVGALAYYALRAPARGLVGVCLANSTPRVAPLGGSTGLHGTNPIAYAAPVQGGEPLVFDAATGHAAARLKQAAEEGDRIPAGMALDRDGRPTTEAQAALDGVLLPVGGALGYGLGLLVDLFAGALGGAPCGVDVPKVTELHGEYGCSFLALAVEPDCFGGRAVFAARSRFLVESARQSRPAAGLERVRVPGDRALEEKRRRLREGIPFPAVRWAAVLARLESCGVDVAAWRNG